MSYTASAIWVFMTLTFWGLVLIFLGVLDIKLLAEHVKTISERVWAGNNLLGIAIVGWVLAAAVFLAGHFWLGWFKPTQSSLDRSGRAAVTPAARAPAGESRPS